MLANFRGNISSLVSRLGRAVTVRVYTNSGTSFDPTRTAADTAATAAVFDFEARETDGSIIQANDKEFVLSSSVPVTQQDAIIDNGVEYSVVNVEQVGPGGSVLMYIVQGRA